jgi:DNA-directed RNA polymerase subunit RPC12/RpoP
MTFRCPGSQIFSQPHPEFMKCRFCGAEVEIWTDEVRARCPACKKITVRKQPQSCLDWCKFAKDCVGEKVYNTYVNFPNVSERN